MKFLLGPILAILSAVPVFAGDLKPFEPPPAPKQLSPQYHAETALRFLESIKTGEEITGSKEYLYRYIRFLSFYNYSEDKFLPIAQQMQAFWINNVHFASDVTLPQQVPGTNGTLYWIDIRDYEWNASAFSSVARREPYFREPMISSPVALVLRDLIEVGQDAKSLHVEAIVRADWFFRETSEADRSDSYFDLLFAKRRFQGGAFENQQYGHYELKGQRVEKGTLGATFKTTETRKVWVPTTFVNFPKDEKEFEKAFGVDAIDKFIEETGINLEHGAVVEGTEKGVSIVARQNRLIKRKSGPIGPYYKTFDVKETTGRRDFAETLQKDFVFDAGEILARTPAGGMAALLVDSKGKIVSVADNRFAIDKSDLVLDVRVRTATSCFVCHEQFAIKPQNMVEDMLKAGVQIKFKNKREQIDARAFFLNWEDDLDGDQAKFSKFIKRTSGFQKPGENAKNFKLWRDKYDAPVTLEIAASEVGMLPEAFKQMALRSTRARVLNLAQGISMPRRTWEVDGYFEAVKLMRSSPP